VKQDTAMEHLSVLFNSFGIETNMTQEDLNTQITQLQQQQAIFTKIIAQQLQGKWTGENSAEAWLYALDPSIQGTLDLDIPIVESEYENPKAQ
jgi:hypothetical protein